MSIRVMKKRCWVSKMIKKIDIDYFEWLVSQIDVRTNRTYMYLFERMHNLEFVWTVPRDHNRVQDGLDLRTEFKHEWNHHQGPNLDMVTILEVLIGVSRRVAFHTDGNNRLWAWKLLKNLRLTKMSDPVDDNKIKKIEEILYNLVWRNYHPSGQGGFFPLRRPVDDQTKVEIWYQMNAYVIEMDNK